MLNVTKKKKNVLLIKRKLIYLVYLHYNVMDSIVNTPHVLFVTGRSYLFCQQMAANASFHLRRQKQRHFTAGTTETRCS